MFGVEGPCGRWGWPTSSGFIGVPSQDLVGGALEGELRGPPSTDPQRPQAIVLQVTSWCPGVLLPYKGTTEVRFWVSGGTVLGTTEVRYPVQRRYGLTKHNSTGCAQRGGGGGVQRRYGRTPYCRLNPSPSGSNCTLPEGGAIQRPAGRASTRSSGQSTRRAVRA
jgi:hypothetical protein